MDVTITQFRRDLFALVDRALEGKPVRVAHKGRKVRIVPEGLKGDKLDRLTPCNYLNPRISMAKVQKQIRQEMEKEWEEDWKNL